MQGRHNMQECQSNYLQSTHIQQQISAQQQQQPCGNTIAITTAARKTAAIDLSQAHELTLHHRFIRVGSLLAEAERHHRMRSKQIKAKNSETRKYACTAREDLLWKALRNYLNESINFYCRSCSQEDDELDAAHTRSLNSSSSSVDQAMDLSFPCIAEWERQVRGAAVWAQPAEALYTLLVALQY